MSTYIPKFDLPKPIFRAPNMGGKGWICRLSEGDKMVWSNDRPLPELGQKIKVTMNGIGFATVIGYFSETVNEGSYIGVMAVPHNPPQWLKKQNRDGAAKADKPLWYRAGVMCVYGAECEV
jgi:hypothetical protein